MKLTKPICQRLKSAAFTRIELMFVLAGVFVLVCLAVVSLGPQVAKARRIACVGRLKNIGLSYRIFSTDNTNSFPFALSTNIGGTREWTFKAVVLPHFKVLSNELSTPIILHCPADKERQPAKDFASLTETNISYFVALSASEAYPNSILSGDRTLMTNGVPLRNQFLDVSKGLVLDFAPGSHGDSRNFVMGDGSVQQLSLARLAAHLKILKQSTNVAERWVFP